MSKVITISAGHSAKGADYGAVSYLDESKEVRVITKYVIEYLKEAGYTVYNCTDDVTTGGVSQHLAEIVARHNKHTANLAVSIHLNSSAKTQSPLGCEVYYSPGGKSVKAKAAKAICHALARLGFKNRGPKTSSGLYFLNHTNDPAILVEAFFVSSKADVALYEKSKKKVAKAIAAGIMEAL